DDKILKDYLIALYKLKVIDDEATEEVSKDEVSPLKQKKRKLTKGGEAVVATRSEAVLEDKREKVTDVVAVETEKLVPEVVIQQKTEAGKKTRSMGKTGDVEVWAKETTAIPSFTALRVAN
ncbi:hypothetical protein Dimus_000744, partial [Dionaea muscipula]